MDSQYTEYGGKTSQSVTITILRVISRIVTSEVYGIYRVDRFVQTVYREYSVWVFSLMLVVIFLLNRRVNIVSHMFPKTVSNPEEVLCINCPEILSTTLGKIIIISKPGIAKLSPSSS